MIVGYARVSTDGQTLDSQLAALKGAGAERVFSEKVSGVVTDRRALGRAIGALSHGDVLLVTRLDRLARSTRDLLNVLDAVSKAGAGFRSLADAWADWLGQAQRDGGKGRTTHLKDFFTGQAG